MFRNSNGSDYNILASSFEDFKKKNIDIQTLLDKKLFESLDKNGEDSNDYEYAQGLFVFFVIQKNIAFCFRFIDQSNTFIS